MVKQARSEVANSVLVDNGDLIQGSPMGDYVAAKGLTPGEVHPAYKAMNLLKYDVANLGNHEFNYGLDFLAEATNDAKFPISMPISSMHNRVKITLIHTLLNHTNLKTLKAKPMRSKWATLVLYRHKS